jgi:[acyl-carrier-protein] S-malonyltransferase
MEQVKQSRYAIVFPGQGSQYVGMGREIAEQFTSASEIVALSEQITGLPIRHLAFFGSEDDLMDTSITQPCLLTISIAAYAVFQERFSLKPDFICGHSAGEYAGLVAAGVLDFADALRLVQIRSSLMSKMQEGSMLALKGVTLQQAEELCRTAVLPGGVLVPANLNSPKQIVISGDINSVESAVFIALEKNIQVVPLSVSGAFHSPLMEQAASKFTESLLNIQFNDSTVPVISNVTAKPVTRGWVWMGLLKKQLICPVLWEPSIRYLEQQGVRVFIEIGPKQILSRLINQIIPSATTINIEDILSLETAIAQLSSILEPFS